MSDLTDDQINSLEAKWDEASKACREEMKAAYAMRDEAAKLAVSISEKYGIPVDWNRGGYQPTSMSKWTSGENLTEDERDYYRDLIADNCYLGEYSKPGQFWYPSRNC